jgi:hypothetical protein
VWSRHHRLVHLFARKPPNCPQTGAIRAQHESGSCTTSIQPAAHRSPGHFASEQTALRTDTLCAASTPPRRTPSQRPAHGCGHVLPGSTRSEAPPPAHCNLTFCCRSRSWARRASYDLRASPTMCRVSTVEGVGVKAHRLQASSKRVAPAKTPRRRRRLAYLDGSPAASAGRPA